MLNIIYGRAGVGKTYTVTELIKNDVQNGKSCILLVPEQFTFESEKSILHLLGNFDSKNVSVLSFTRLFDEITRIKGGNSKYVINDAEKCIFMSRALKTVKDKLILWKNYNNPNFILNAVSTVNELKLASISAKELTLTSEITDNISLKHKLHDLSLIYNAYDALLINKFIDPVDKMTYICSILENYNFFKGKNVYIDSFQAFSGVQLNIIEKIISNADNVTFSINCDSIEGNEINIFANTRKTVQKIISIAKKYAVKINEPIKLTEQHYVNSDVASVEALLATGKIGKEIEKSDNITIFKAENKSGEASFVASNIRKLVRTGKYRYNDFVVISRNAEDYTNEVLSECNKNKVFCFADLRTRLCETPLIFTLKFALNSIKSLKTENILHFLKTGFANLTFDEISEVENYVYLWNSNTVNWQKVWKMNPEGLQFTENETQKDIADKKEKLDYLNNLRVKAIKPLLKLKEEFKGNAVSRATALYNLLEFCNVTNKLDELLKADESIYNYNENETLKQSWKYTVSLLDSIVKCYDDENITDDEFIDAFNVLADLTTVGNVPQMLDEVTFGSADRIRPSRPKIVFLVGANQGVFPSLPKNRGLLGINDRNSLINLGFQISNNTLSNSIDENMLVYSSVSCATEKIYISYSCTDINGEKSEPSAFVGNIIDALHPIEITQSDEIDIKNLPETEFTAFDAYCKTFSLSNNEKDKIFESLITNETLKERIERVKKSENFDKTELSSETSERLFGKNFRLSASQFDKYYKCSFSYFCEYGLSAKVLSPAELNTLQRGTITHYALERFVNNHKTDIRTVNKSDAKAEIENYINEFLNSIQGYEEIKDERFEYLIKKVIEGTVATAYRIIDEFLHSAFNPEYCEMKIGYSDADPEVNLDFGKNGSISLRGSVDRVDAWNDYVRIIDYKTGTKNFKLSDALFGLNMQMLIYLYALIRSDKSVYKNFTPAGILYMISKKNTKSEDTPSNGIIINDETVANAMNDDNDGRFLPQMKFDNDGNIKGSSYVNRTTFDEIFDYIEFLSKKMVENLTAGKIEINPTDGTKKACEYCNYSEVCNFKGEHTQIPSRLKESEIIELMKERRMVQ